MLFNSYSFIFVFLPITLAGFFILGRAKNHRPALSWLICASLFFYGWWNPNHLWLIGFSILFNYWTGVRLAGIPRQRHKFRKGILTVGVVVNLLLLAWFKYLVFILGSLDNLLQTSFSPGFAILIPLAISFFTFQQIAYLVDTYRKKTFEPDFLNYCLFVTFFPQLIAGPIVHHKEMLPQFARPETFRFSWENLSAGLAFFCVGLFKKAIVADGLGKYADPVFAMAAEGTPVTLLGAWGGMIAFALQVYFDFSAYTDMAIGGAKMFGIHLPINFDSPFKAPNLFEFWRRWHVTLGRFMRLHAFLPLAKNRLIPMNHLTALVISVILGGLWHGGGWTFIAWGAGNGLLLLVNHFWHRFRRLLGHNLSQSTRLGAAAAVVLTFWATAYLGIFFRAETMGAAWNIMKGVWGANGFVLPPYYLPHIQSLGPFLSDFLLVNLDVQFGETPGYFGKMQIVWILSVLFVIWFMPNTQELMKNHVNVIQPFGNEKKAAFSLFSGDALERIRFKMNPPWAALMAALFILSVSALTRLERFIYFQF